MIPVPLILLFVSFIWGTSFVATEIALKDCSVLTVIVLRLFIASAVFAGILLFRKEWRRKITGQIIVQLVIAGLLSVSFYHLLQVWAIKFSNASVTSLFITMHPIILSLFGLIFFREKLGKYKTLGILAGFVGSVAIATKGRFILAEDTDYLLALGLTFLNALMWAGYSSVAKKISGRFSSFDTTALMTIIGFVPFLPFAFIFDDLFKADIMLEISSLSLSAVIAISYLALVCTIVAYVLWLYSLNKSEVSKAGYYLYLIPLFTTVTAPLFVGNQLTGSLVIGGLIIFIGLFLINVDKIFKRKTTIHNKDI